MRRLKAPVFFANASRGLTRPDQCLNHLAVELIARFGLAHDHLPARSGEDSAFLGKVLAEAAEKAEGPFWIVVDALDEADPPGPGPQHAAAARSASSARHLRVPDAPHDRWSLSSPPGRRPTINSSSRLPTTASRADIEEYAVLGRPARRCPPRRVEARIRVSRSIGSSLSLKEMSQGNFKYLDYVLVDIAAHQPGCDPLDLAVLPSGPAGLLSALLDPDGATEGPGRQGRVGGPLPPHDRLPGRGTRGCDGPYGCPAMSAVRPRKSKSEPFDTGNASLSWRASRGRRSSWARGPSIVR